MNRLLPLTLAGALLVAPTCAIPERDYDLEQIRLIDQVEELMWVQATVADPRFAEAETLRPGQIGELRRGAFLDMAVRLQATADVLATLSTDPGFQALARQLGQRAADVERAVDMNDAHAVLETTLAVRAACAACHAAFR